MKDKIILFIVGLLLGAIISTGSIYIYTVASSKNNNAQNNMQTPNGNTMKDNQNGNTPSEMPNGNQGTAPEKPNGETNTNA